MRQTVPFIKPEFPSVEAIAQDYATIVQNNYYTNGGPFDQELIVKIDEFIGREVHSTLVANATLGLLLAIKATFRGAHKKALVASFTFTAGPEALLWCGYKPVFMDINETSWQPSLQEATNYIERHYSDLGGVLLTNTFGVGNPEISKWEDLCKRFDLPLVIDSAAGFGSQYEPGEYLGTRGDCEVFSFHATKPFAIGEGGAVTSKSHSLINKINEMKNFGFDKSKMTASLGLNAKLQEITCAIGIRQLTVLRDRVHANQAVLRNYQTALGPLGYQMMPNSLASSVCFASFNLEGSPNELILQALGRELIQARSYYSPPLHQHPLFKGCEKASSLDSTLRLSQSIISLPVHSGVNEEVISKITQVLQKAKVNAR